MLSEQLFSEFVCARVRAERHLSWLRRQFGLPAEIVSPFGKAIIGLDQCRLLDTGLYTTALDGHKCIIVAESISLIPHSKTGIAEIIELVAIPIAAPNRWFLRTGNGLFLGHENLKHRIDKRSITIHETPLSWLRAGGNGLCILNHRRVNSWSLIRAGPVVFESAALEQKLLYSRVPTFKTNHSRHNNGDNHVRNHPQHPRTVFW